MTIHPIPYTLTPDADARVLHVALTGQLVTQNRTAFKQALRAFLDTHPGWAVRIDLAASGYLDSSGLGVLVSVTKRARETGGDVVLVNVHDEVRTHLKLTKLDTLFTLPPERP